MSTTHNNHPNHTVVDLSEWIELVDRLMVSHLDHIQDHLNITAEHAPDQSGRLTGFWLRDYAVAYVRQAVDDCLNCCMAWSHSQPDVALHHLCDTIMLFNVSVVLDPSWLRDSIWELLDPVNVGIMEITDDLTGPEPWNVWSTRFRYDYVFFEYGGDYRINYFMDHHKQGTLTHETGA